MPELKATYVRQRKYIFLLLSIYVLGWGFTSYQSIFLGLVKATREHNDSNMLAMGERVIGPGLAREIAKVWLTTDYEGGRHENRVGKIKDYENK